MSKKTDPITGDSASHKSPSLAQEASSWELDVEIVYRSGGWAEAGLDEDLMRRAARGAYSAATIARAPVREVAIVLVSDAEVRGLNAKWRNQDKPTNVLSFGLVDEGGDFGGVRGLGDIVLACETVLSEAGENALGLNEHAAHLVAHGMLHLLGYDHKGDDEARKMEDLERQILGGLGISDPYARAETALIQGA